MPTANMQVFSLSNSKPFSVCYRAILLQEAVLHVYPFLPESFPLSKAAWNYLVVWGFWRCFVVVGGFGFVFLESGGSKGAKISYFTAICTQFRAVIQVKELGNVLKHYTAREQTQTKCKGTILDRYTAVCQDQNLVWCMVPHACD